MKLITPCPDNGGYRKFGYERTDGRLHCGHDYNAPEGTEIKSIATGTLIFSNPVNGFGSYGQPGYVTVIRYPDFFGIYGHLQEKMKKWLGGQVEQGEIIGKLAEYRTQRFNADHLHFCIYMPKIKKTTTGIPPFPWGYRETLYNWHDPVKFIFERS